MTKIKLPSKYDGMDTNEAYNRINAGITPTIITSPKPLVNPSNPAPDKDGFIYVPSMNLYIAKERSLHRSNWDRSHEGLQNDGKRMLTIPEFWNFVTYLKAGYQDRNEAQNILDDIFKVGAWRAEWLDAHFEKKGEEFYINYMHELKNGTLTPKHSDKLEICLMEDCYANLIPINRQGLLTEKSSTQSYVQGSNVYFWYPRNTAVARFNVNSDWAYLDCNWDRSYSYADLGVRSVFENK